VKLPANQSFLVDGVASVAVKSTVPAVKNGPKRRPEKGKGEPLSRERGREGIIIIII